MRHATRRIIVAAALGLAVGVAGRAKAGVITEFTTGSDSLNTNIPGQSATTPAGGPFNNISFNFFDTGGNPLAFGDLFILTKEYLGTPADLNESTPGFLAESTTVSGGQYVFDAAVTLQANTQYFFYADQASSALVGSIRGGYAGGSQYGALTAADNFVALGRSDINFRLSGTATAVPEPSTLALTAVAGLAGLGCLWRRRRAVRPA
jgi:hypothetical protein